VPSASVSTGGGKTECAHSVHSAPGQGSRPSDDRTVRVMLAGAGERYCCTTHEQHDAKTLVGRRVKPSLRPNDVADSTQCERDAQHRRSYTRSDACSGHQRRIGEPCPGCGKQQSSRFPASGLSDSHTFSTNTVLSPHMRQSSWGFRNSMRDPMACRGLPGPNTSKSICGAVRHWVSCSVS